MIGTEVVCADPGPRAAQRFDRSTMPQIPAVAANLHGGGVTVSDFDDDGRLDLLLLGEDRSELHLGSAAGWVDHTAAGLGGIDLTGAVAATPADLDGDGDLDLFVVRWQAPPVLLRNDGGAVFVDVTAASGLDTYSWRSQSASIADMDGDGDLDIFSGSYGEWTILNVNDPVPDCTDHLADPSELWRNDGGLVFRDLSAQLPQAVHDGYVFASAWFDLDHDGYPELFSAHDDGLCGPSTLVDNIAGTSFTVDSTAGFHPNGHDMGLGLGDLNGDAQPDFVISSWKVATVLESVVAGAPQNGVFWVDSSAVRTLFVDPDDQVFGWASELGDVDNDTDLDAVLTFGYWSTYDGAGDPLDQFDGLWLQDAGTFSDVAGQLPWAVNDRGIGRGALLVDLDGNGWLDLLKRQMGNVAGTVDGPTVQYLARCGDEAWLTVDLRAPSPNTRGVGARIEVDAGGTVLNRWIGAGNGGLYVGHPPEAHFGLGNHDFVDLRVFWTDGSISQFPAVPTRRRVRVERAW